MDTLDNAYDDTSGISFNSKFVTKVELDTVVNKLEVGYHLRDIKKGEYGKFSKIEEEYDELLEANEQNNKILMLVEVSDLYGAIEAYIEKEYNLTMGDIKKMSDATKRAFINGKRK